jgi:thiopeptide-type bacteriocin biosynthesis protein
MLDDALRRVIAPVVRRAVDAGAVSHWFFIRYSDPDSHLRLRLCGSPDRLQAEVQPALWAAAHALFDDGRVWRLQLDTYHREIERYGGPEGVLTCEQLFSADSDAVLSIVELLEGAPGADARWRLALLGCDRLLDDLGFDLSGKITIMDDLAAGYAREFSVDTDFERSLGNRFRRERASLEELLAGVTDPEHPLAPGIAILTARSDRQRPLGAALRETERRGALTAPLPAIAQALLHMHCNRLLRGAARAQELVLYDFLARLYDGQQSRARRRRDP